MNQKFGWDIFQEELKSKPAENVLISPLSIQTALQMANNAASGQTLDQLRNALHCEGCPVADLNKLHQDLATLLTEQSGAAKLTIANGFFYDKDRLIVQPTFLDVVDEFYKCGAAQTDFDNEQAALGLVNNWVKTGTNGKIDKILDKITPFDIAFLINALHFKADWATGFSPDLTASADFSKLDGSKTSVEMVQADRKFTFVLGTAFNMVDLPFKDSTFSLSLVQASATNTGADWHLGLSVADWKKLYENVQKGRAIVSFPKLKLAYKNDLIGSLKKLGVEDAFSENAADFKLLGSSPTGQNIFIKQIAHKAVLEVDEKGAEGAAVTSIGFGFNSLPPVLRFDRPFVLVLRHVATNSLVFTGFVADPAF